MCVSVYLLQARHLSFLKRGSNGGSEGLTVFYWSAFQEVFSCLVNVHLDHLPFELSPHRHQHLQNRNQIIINVTIKFKNIFKVTQLIIHKPLWMYSLNNECILLTRGEIYSATCHHSLKMADLNNHPFKRINSHLHFSPHLSCTFSINHCSKLFPILPHIFYLASPCLLKRKHRAECFQLHLWMPSR